MRKRILGFTAAASLAGAAIGGCVDLFHSTDFDSLCSFDAAACGVPEGSAGPEADAGPADVPAREADAPDGPTDFCAWSKQDAHDNARRACAWLGACAGPFGNNEFGTCLDNALRAYDCALNPNRPVINAAHAYWDCLWKASVAKSCDAVMRCIFPKVTPPCAINGSEFTVCAGTSGPENASSRMDCLASDASLPPAAAENCVAIGQTCPGSAATCAGSAGPCTASGCLGDHLIDCSGAGVDNGVDCTNFGGGKCGSAGAGTGTEACLAWGDAGCLRDSGIACDGGVAVSCPSGVREIIDCQSLMEDAGRCLEGAPGRRWDLSRACVANDDAGCTDSCSGGDRLLACHRGKQVEVTCSAFGLGGGCEMVTHVTLTRPACKKP